MAGVRESKTSPRRITTAKRRAEALQMRLDGAKYDDIATALNYATRGAAAQDVQRAIMLMVAEPAAEVRAMELARLDEMWQAARGVRKREHITVANGRVIEVEVDGEKKNLVDDGPVLQAIDRLLRIQERRAKLLGLDAPTKVEVINDDLIDAEIRKLTDELDRNAAAQAADAEDAEAAQG